MLKLVACLSGAAAVVGTAVVVHRPMPTPASAVVAHHARPTTRAIEVRREHDRVLREIEVHRSARAVQATPPPDRVGSLDPDYVRQAIHEILPLIRECYENALVARPTMAGTLLVHMTITAEPGVGGVVADSHIVDDKSSLDDAETRECVLESMYAARFPAPLGGGDVEVDYPFTLRPADDTK